MVLFRKLIIWLVSFASCSAVALADRLDETLASALFRASSPKCIGAPVTFSANFTSTNDVSHWDIATAKYEQDVFAMDMIHQDSEPHRSWILRIGKGGQIMSLRLDVGEAIANQAVEDAVWNDLVEQLVSVNGELNKVAPNFIHQAGPYMRDDGMPPPFFSPQVAFHCGNSECSTINWGMQAHVPTSFDSPLLYYTRYRNCGYGVVEVDMIIHHFGLVQGDIYDYFNTPWTGIRTSTFRDLMISNQLGRLEHSFPLTTFGPNLRNLDQTGGFTTFAEDLELESDEFDFGFCVDTNNVLPQTADASCDNSSPSVIPFQLQVQENGSARLTGHSTTYGVETTVSMRLCDLQAPVRIGHSGWGNPYDGVLLINDRTGFTFSSDFIIHYCWEDRRTYLSSNVSVAILNEEFRQGDTITVKWVTSGKLYNDQAGLTFVHGTNPEYYSGAGYYRAKSRMRFGTTNNRRDGTVWTTNFIGRLYRTETYFSRKYLITDKLDNMETVASPFTDEAFEDVDEVLDLPNGETIKLWINQDFFGASIGSESCGATNTSLVCQGSAIPKDGFRPLFFIACGSSVATTSNPYYFSVIVGTEKKPYMCVDATDDSVTRAEWKLLGYFPSEGCTEIGDRTYKPEFCDSHPESLPPETEAPTSACEDSEDWAFVQTNGIERGCLWVSSKPYSIFREGGSRSHVRTTRHNIFTRQFEFRGRGVRQKGRCYEMGVNGFRARNACPVACGTCDCRDSQDWIYVSSPIGDEKNCEWVADRPYFDNEQKRGRCLLEGINGMLALDACPLACGTCG